MSSDFQRVKVVEGSEGTVVLEVTEYHPDADGIHYLLSPLGAEYAAKSLARPRTRTAIPRAKADDARSALPREPGDRPQGSGVVGGLQGRPALRRPRLADHRLGDRMSRLRRLAAPAQPPG